MKEFILIVRVPTSYTSEQAKTVNPEWDRVLHQWKANQAFVTSYVFPGESFVVSGADKLVKNEFVITDNRKIVSSIVLQAPDLEQAVDLAKDCPVLKYGGTVEVREIPPRVAPLG